MPNENKTKIPSMNSMRTWKLTTSKSLWFMDHSVSYESYWGWNFQLMDSPTGQPQCQQRCAHAPLNENNTQIPSMNCLRARQLTISMSLWFSDHSVTFKAVGDGIFSLWMPRFDGSTPMPKNMWKYVPVR